MKFMNVKLTFTDEVLGSQPANPAVHDTYVRSKAPRDADDEWVPELDERGVTVFNRDEEGRPCVLDYQIKGMFKDAAQMLRRVDGTSSKGLKAYKKIIDGLIFIYPRHIPFEFDGEIGDCQRPLRVSTPQGERVALADSETIPAGSSIAFKVKVLDDSLTDLVAEWLDYGEDRGLGQWRNSGKGRFTWEEL